MLLTKEQILKVEGRRFKTIEVPELGGSLRIASLSAGASLKLKQLGDTDDQRAMALVMFKGSIVDEKNAPMFDAEATEAFLDAISVETLGFILGEITSLSARKKGTNGAEVAETNPSSAVLSVSSPSA